MPLHQGRRRSPSPLAGEGWGGGDRPLSRLDPATVAVDPGNASVARPVAGSDLSPHPTSPARGEATKKAAPPPDATALPPRGEGDPSGAVQRGLLPGPHRERLARPHRDVVA